MQACNDFLNLAQAYEKKFQKSLNVERVKRRRLEETVETLAKQHNKLEQVCKNVDIRSMSMGNLHGHQTAQIARSPGGTIELEEDDEDDHDEFFDAMSEHPEAFGMKCENQSNDFIDQSGNDPYSDIDESCETLSMGRAVAYPAEKIKIIDPDVKFQIRRSISEKQLEGLTQQEMGHRRAISYDLRDRVKVCACLIIFSYKKLFLKPGVQKIAIWRQLSLPNFFHLETRRIVCCDSW